MTEGANGLKLSLNFTFKFRFFCIFSDLGSAIIDLAPKALGPNSILPWNQPIVFSFDNSRAVIFNNSSSGNFSKVAPNEKDTSKSKFRRIIKANNNKTKNAGYNSYAQYLGVEPEKVKKWFGWIGEVPQDSKYEKIKSYVDFISTGVDMNKLMTHDIPPLQYAVEPILPEGFACVAGRPKSMKSWTMLDMIFCIQNGLPFWDHKTVQGDCLGIFNEDGKRRLKDRIIKLGHQKLKFPTIALEAPYLGFGLEESIIDSTYFINTSDKYFKAITK